MEVIEKTQQNMNTPEVDMLVKPTSALLKNVNLC